MTRPPTIRRQRIPSYTSYEPGAGELGRHIHHDDRSWAYRYDTSALTLVTTVHQRRTPILDQGDLGSCTGNAGIGTLGTDPFYGTLPAGTILDETAAVEVYSAATRLDDYSGSYPPDDTGSDGLSVAKVLKARGWISGYQHTFSPADFRLALTATPVMVGINWYGSFDAPDSSGRIRITPGASVRGGHEVEAFAVDVERRLIGLDNSWGPGWGLHGTCWVGWDDADRLLGEQGDATILTPLSQPAPVPDPVPVVVADAADLDLWSAETRAWAFARHCGANAEAARAVQAWRTRKGLS